MKYRVYIKLFVIIIAFTTSVRVFSQDCNLKSWYSSYIDDLDVKLKDCGLSDYDVLDFSKVLTKNKDAYIGYIGRNKKRLVINFKTIKRDSIHKDKYHVIGNTKVGKNERDFKGYIILDDICCFENFSYGIDSWMEGKIKNQGIATGKFYFSENSKYSATGSFEGILVLKWFIDNNGKLKYDDIENDRDSYANNEFLGTWTSYKTKKSQIVAWGQYRIPCAGDLDIGAGEFSPNPKYYKYGWANYKS